MGRATVTATASSYGARVAEQPITPWQLAGAWRAWKGNFMQPAVSPVVPPGATVSPRGLAVLPVTTPEMQPAIPGHASVRCHTTVHHRTQRVPYIARTARTYSYSRLLILHDMEAALYHVYRCIHLLLPDVQAGNKSHGVASRSQQQHAPFSRHLHQLPRLASVLEAETQD